MRIVSGFPGTGKSTFVKSHPLTIDLDSALFEKGEGFVDSYVEAIEEHLKTPGRCVFVSTHPPLLEGLKAKGYEFILIYPGHVLKDEYLARYEGRGDWKEFLEQLDENWYNYIGGLNDLNLNRGSKRVILQRYETISDVLHYDAEKGLVLK